MKRSVRIALNIISIVCVLGYLAICVWRMMAEKSDGLAVVLWIVLFVVSELTAGVFHELGHALFGLLSGLRGKLSKSSVFSLDKPLSVGLIPRTDKNLKGRMIVTSLGGLAVNLLFIAAGVLALSVPQIPVWISGIAVSNISVFIDNALPAEYKTGKTDGLVVLELIRNEPPAQVMLAVLAVHAHILNGESIETVDKNLLFNLPQIREDDASFISLTELRARYCKAVGDEENAEKYRARFEQLKAEYLD